MAVVWNRRFITGPERNDVVGIGPPKTKVEDWICVLFGCSVPVILRPFVEEDGKPSFHFIGEAYIYGKMDGEAIADLGDELESKQVEFRIK